MRRFKTWAVWLWSLQALTGLLLVVYVVVHTLDNATILLGQEAYESMLALWHETLPHWFYILMVIGLVGIFLIHAANGIRIASKPYRDIDVSVRQNWLLKHHGTTFWYMQVATGSAIAMFAVWHLIVQHGTVATTTAVQSAERVSVTVFIMYVIFMAALMFHSFNGLRAVLLKLGIMTDRAKEAILISVVALLFIIFFVLGAASIARFIPAPQIETAPAAGTVSVHESGALERADGPRAADDLPIFVGTAGEKKQPESADVDDEAEETEVDVPGSGEE